MRKWDDYKWADDNFYRWVSRIHLGTSEFFRLSSALKLRVLYYQLFGLHHNGPKVKKLIRKYEKKLGVKTRLPKEDETLKMIRRSCFTKMLNAKTDAELSARTRHFEQAWMNERKHKAPVTKCVLIDSEWFRKNARRSGIWH